MPTQLAGNQLTSSSTVRTASSLVACDLGDEIVILSEQSGVYYGLNAVGSRIWELIQAPLDVSQLCAALQAEYDVPAEQCEREVLVLLERMAAEGLVEVADEVAS